MKVHKKTLERAWSTLDLIARGSEELFSRCENAGDTGGRERYRAMANLAQYCADIMRRIIDNDDDDARLVVADLETSVLKLIDSELASSIEYRVSR